MSESRYDAFQALDRPFGKEDNRALRGLRCALWQELAGRQVEWGEVVEFFGSGREPVGATV